MSPPEILLRQQGVVLLLTLLTLVVVSLLGTAALRTSLFGARMAAGTEIDAMAFAGAESAIDATLRSLESHPERLRSLLAGNTLTQCVTLAGQARVGACESGDYLDPGALVVAEALARRVGRQSIADDSDGAAPTMTEYRIAVLGEAAIARFGRHQYHLQEVVVSVPEHADETSVRNRVLHRSGWHPLSRMEAETFLASGGGE